MASDDIEVTALRDFPLTKGRKVVKGETFTLPNYDARSLIVANLVERTGSQRAPGLYNRRDMQAEQLTRTENAIPKATRQVDAEGSSPSRRGVRS